MDGYIQYICIYMYVYKTIRICSILNVMDIEMEKEKTTVERWGKDLKGKGTKSREEK